MKKKKKKRQRLESILHLKQDNILIQTKTGSAASSEITGKSEI